MRTVRHSPIGTGRDCSLNEYALATGRSSAAIANKRIRPTCHVVAGAGLADSAIALSSQVSTGPEAGLVPSFADDSRPEASPINNMGENSAGKPGARWNALSDEHLGHVQLVMTDSGEVKTVMVRRPAEKQVCIIDWINFTVSEDTWCKTAREGLISDDQFVAEASRQLEKIFGFGVTTKRDRGMNFYRDSWVLGDNMGFVCFGGQRSTMLITLSGHGCLHALPGWEKRLHGFLTKTAIRPSLSRVDLAHDDFEGAYLSVDWAEAQWEAGGFSFSKGGRPPEVQNLGNWKKPNGKGRTLAVGTRTSSKYARFYERGKKEGDKSSLWCRGEIEFKNTNSIIPFDILLNPSQYFVGAYPCLATLLEIESSARMEAKRRTAVINMDASEKWMQTQVGKYLRVWRELYGDKEALDRLCCSDDDYWPKRLKPLTDSATSGPIPIHKQEPVNVPSFLHFIKTVPSFGLNGENGFA